MGTLPPLLCSCEKNTEIPSVHARGLENVNFLSLRERSPFEVF